MVNVILQEDSSRLADANIRKDLGFDDPFQKGYIAGLKVGQGLCQSCGALDESTHFTCKEHSHLVCAKCALQDLDGHFSCRACVEEKYGIKQDSIVLLTIASGLPRSRAKRITDLSNEVFEDVESRLLRVGYAKKKGTGILGGELTITQSGITAAIMTFKAFSRDADFQIFLSRLSKVSEKWKKLVMTGITN